VIYEARSKEWFEARQKVITGTEVSSLFGLNSYKSVPSIVRDKNGKPDVMQDNIHLKKGRIFEPAVIQLCIENGFELEPAAPFGKVAFLTKGRLGCSLDAVGKYKSHSVIAEIKTTSKDKYETWEISPPLNYLLQLQVELICSDHDRGLLAVASIPMDDLQSMVFGVIKSKKIADLIDKEVNRFWDCFETDTQFKVNQVNKKKITEELGKVWKRIF